MLLIGTSMAVTDIFGPNVINVYFGLIGLLLAGFCLAPLFPVVTFDTSQRLGAERAAKVIGYQGTAVKLGLAALPALAGIMVEGMGAQVVGPFLVVLSVVALLLHEASLRVKLRG